MNMEEDLKVIQDVCKYLEEVINGEIKEVLEQHNKGVAANVLINVGTSLLAKAVILVTPDHRDSVYELIVMALNSKIKEGDAAVESLMAIGKAMQSTCRPPPTKH